MGRSASPSVIGPGLRPVVDCYHRALPSDGYRARPAHRQSRLAKARLKSAKSPVRSPVVLLAPVPVGSQEQVQVVGCGGSARSLTACWRTPRRAAGAPVVSAEPGIGRSALLSFARQQAPPMLRCPRAARRADSDRAFAGLHKLLRPVLDYLGELGDTQWQALAGALCRCGLRSPTGCSAAQRCSACSPGAQWLMSHEFQIAGLSPGSTNREIATHHLRLATSPMRPAAPAGIVEACQPALLIAPTVPGRPGS